MKTWEQDRGEVFARLNNLAVNQSDMKEAVCQLKGSFETFRINAVRDVTDLKARSKLTAAITAVIISILTSSAVGAIISVAIARSTQ